MFAQSHLLFLTASSVTKKPQLSSSTFCYKLKHTQYHNNNNAVDFQTRDVGSNKRKSIGTRRYVCNAIQHERQNTEVTAPEMKIEVPNAIKDYITSIKSIFDSMGDGEINESAYDTAWVALIKDVNGNDAPQFPSCLEWIANHQLEDGSWGDSSFFGAHDRILNTLACVVALKSWNVYPEALERGISFIKECMHKLHEDKEENLLVGFEVTFPSLLDMAQKLDIEVVTDSTLLEEYYVKRNLKLNKIPKEVLHNRPTSLLYSLEGFTTMGMDWEKLLKLQFEDGSFFNSPASTAFAFMQTNDENCLRFLQRTLKSFHGGVPCVYPLDLFERMWAIDKLQRLGVSRHFQTEFDECLRYVYSFWTEEGIGPTRNCRVQDVDDTSMGFRLLRLQGFHVSPDVFKHYEEGEDFVCYAGQSIPGVSDTYNLFRASLLMFPGETILQKAKNFSFKFLKDKQASNQLHDKWFIYKDLPGEVGYALDCPWFANLPHIETRFFIEQYGGEDDVCIAKTFYRLRHVSNNKYLELAKLDFKRTQALQQLEWKAFQKWYADSKFGGLGISTDELLLAYFLAAASIFEPERCHERVAWAKTAVLMKIIAFYFNNEGSCTKDLVTFIDKFKSYDSDATVQDCLTSKRNKSYPELNTTSDVIEVLVGSLVKTINQLSVVAGGRDIRQRLYLAWEKWLKTLHEEGNGYLGEAELLVHTLYHCGEPRSDLDNDSFSSHGHQHLIQVTNNVCNKLRHFRIQKYENNKSHEEMITDPKIEAEMQVLVQLVYQNSRDSNDDANIKQTCLAIAKTFYYTAYCDQKTINSHIAKVLFEVLD